MRTMWNGSHHIYLHYWKLISFIQWMHQTSSSLDDERHISCWINKYLQHFWFMHDTVGHSPLLLHSRVYTRYHAISGISISYTHNIFVPSFDRANPSNGRWKFPIATNYYPLLLYLIFQTNWIKITRKIIIMAIIFQFIVWCSMELMLKHFDWFLIVHFKWKYEQQNNPVIIYS